MDKNAIVFCLDEAIRCLQEQDELLDVSAVKRVIERREKRWREAGFTGERAKRVGDLTMDYIVSLVNAAGGTK